MVKIFCKNCGYVGKSCSKTKGSIFIEIILWLFFIPGIIFWPLLLIGILGVIYSIWRLTATYKICPKCKSSSIIPVDSPMASKFFKENFPNKYYQNLEEFIDTGNIGYKIGRMSGYIWYKLKNYTHKRE